MSTPFLSCHPTPKEEAICWAGSPVPRPRALPMVVTVTRRSTFLQGAGPQHSLDSLQGTRPVLPWPDLHLRSFHLPEPESRSLDGAVPSSRAHVS